MPSAPHILQTEFLQSCSALEHLPESDRPEFGFLGRSNVGKSSLINRLLKRKNLAKTSSNPGKTRLINFYDVSIRTEEGEQRELRFVDFPGYGYAKFSKKERAYLRQLTEECLVKRPSIVAVCLLQDCRRMPGVEELEHQQMLFELGKNMVPVVTKIDKIGRNKRQAEIKKIAESLNLVAGDVVVTGNTEGTEELWQRILLLTAL